MRDIPILFEAETVAAIQRLLDLGWPRPWEVVTLLGSNWGVLLVVGMGLWFWGRRTAYALLVVVVVDGVLKTALNSVLFVPRPDGAGIVKYEHVELGSFPSGHVSTASALWGWLAFRGRIPWLLAGAVMVVVGLSRLYLGVHFVGDVLGGAVLAGVVIALVAWLWPPVRSWLSGRPFSYWVIAAVLALAGVVAAGFFYFGSNPYKWRAGGLVAGLAIALPLEHRYVRYRPGRMEGWQKAVTLLVGGVGIAVPAALDQQADQTSNILGLALTAGAGLWALLVVPTLLAVLGWSEKGEPRQEERVARAARGLAVALGALAVVVGYGAGVEPRLILDVEEHQVEVPGLPPEWEGERVAIVSDFQVGLWLDNTGMMRRAVAAIVDDDPAAAVVAGDFIYEPGTRPGEPIGEVMAILEPLTSSGIPVYAVLGNHDWGLPYPLGRSEPEREAARMLRDTLEAVGVTVLHNRWARAPAPGSADGRDDDAGLYLVGVGSRYMEMDDAEAALEGLPAGAARLVVMHNPQSFPAFPAGSAPVAVAGHTHGGQARIPFTPSWSWLTFTADEEVHADGWARNRFGAEGNRLYVTRGIGMSVIPMRFNCPPELTFFTLAGGPTLALERD